MRRFVPGIMAALAGILFGLPYLYPQLFPLSWIAFIPLLWSLNNAKPSEAYLLGLVFGLSCYIVACYWIVDFLILFKQYNPVWSSLFGALFWLYSAQLPALACWFFKRLNKLSTWYTFPIVFAFFYSWFPMLFSAQIGESQSLFVWALQATDLVGVYGLDLIILLFNVWLFQLLFSTRENQSAIPCWFSLCVFGLWFGYGIYSFQVWQKQEDLWNSATIGIVQPNEAPIVNSTQTAAGFSRAYPPEMAMTEQLTQKNTDLVIWPETRYKGYFDHAKVRTAYQAQIKRLNTPLLFQDLNKTESIYNTAALLDNQGELAGEYQKIKRVAFGEYIPLIENVPLLYNATQQYLGQFLTEVRKGTQQTSFKLDKFRLVPLICYEIMFANFVAEAIPENPQNTIITAQSSNGWFGVTRQPFQHMYAGSLRAVENRLPLVHAVNNGPSSVALPSGELIVLSELRQSGVYSVKVPLATQQSKTFFARYPNLILYGVAILFLSLVVHVFSNKKSRA